MARSFRRIFLKPCPRMSRSMTCSASQLEREWQTKAAAMKFIPWTYPTSPSALAYPTKTSLRQLRYYVIWKVGCSGCVRGRSFSICRRVLSHQVGESGAWGGNDQFQGMVASHRSIQIHLGLHWHPPLGDFIVLQRYFPKVFQVFVGCYRVRECLAGLLLFCPPIGCFKSEYFRQMSNQDFDWLLNLFVFFSETLPLLSPSEQSSYRPQLTVLSGCELFSVLSLSPCLELFWLNLWLTAVLRDFVWLGCNYSLLELTDSFISSGRGKDRAGCQYVEGVVERVLVWFFRLTEPARLKSKILWADYMQLKPCPIPYYTPRRNSHSPPAASKKEPSSRLKYLLRSS